MPHRPAKRKSIDPLQCAPDCVIAIHRFLLGRGKLEHFKISSIPGDCSKRLYWRIYTKDGSMILSDSSQEITAYHKFIKVDEWLLHKGLRAPKIFASDDDKQLLLLEDFGPITLNQWLLDHPHQEQAMYQKALDVLLQLRAQKLDISIPSYDVSFLNNQLLAFTENCLPTVIASGSLNEAKGQLFAILERLYQPLFAGKQVVAMRDYHAENLMVLPDGELGMIDFQDAMFAHPCYDLMCLLQDARRNVSQNLKTACLQYYHSQVPEDDLELFNICYLTLAAHHSLRLVALFHRLIKSGHSRYQPCLPRTLSYFQHNLGHPYLQPMLDWIKRYELLPKFYGLANG